MYSTSSRVFGNQTDGYKVELTGNDGVKRTLPDVFSNQRDAFLAAFAPEPKTRKPSKKKA